MKLALLLSVLCLAGCSHPVKPDPIAPVIMTDIQHTECPPPALRVPSEELTARAVLEKPTILPAGQGDYGITRGDLEKIVAELHYAGSKLAKWKAWALGK